MKVLKEEKEQRERKCASLELENEKLGSECTQLLATNSQLALDNSLLQAQKFGVQDNKKTLFYTGLPTCKIFSTLFDLLQPYYRLYRHDTPNIDQFFAVLMYLRLHTPIDDLAYRFKISKSQVSRFFHSWMDTIYILQPLVTWPDAGTLQDIMPVVFRKHFSDVRCNRIFIQRPVSFQAQTATYSNYMKHNTVKILIGISPSGVITFISKTWIGRR